MISLRECSRYLRNRFGAPGLLAIAALVFAMVGGAIAASPGLNSKQKKEVKNIAKSFAGKPGATGPAGATGPGGATGPQGQQGPPGADGDDGSSVEVTEIETGEPECNELGGAEVKEEGAASGEEVCNGAPWAAGGTLPGEATLTGAWSALITATTATLEALTFNIPLDPSACTAEANKGCLPAGSVHKSTDANFATFCEGTAEDPKADPGHLCVYIAKIEGAGAAVQNVVPAGTPELTGSLAGASTAGAILFIEGAPNTLIRGTFAVTAP